MPTSAFPFILNNSDALASDVQNLLAKDIFKSFSSSEGLLGFLLVKEKRLTVQLNINNESLSLHIDFVAGKSKHRRLYGGGKNQPLAKACGLYKHPRWTIFDATAGLARDAFVLASLGAQVTLCEQHPALYALLVDAISRARDDADIAPVINRMQCLHQNSIEYLVAIRNNNEQRPDVIYLDPMYPDRKKSAKIKKEMQVLQYLVGHADDEKSLFESALNTALHRVVVKRPKSAKRLNDKAPSYEVNSPNTRYDVYVIKC